MAKQQNKAASTKVGQAQSSVSNVLKIKYTHIAKYSNC